jgi:D-alanine--poly(phosphoribitol) ligase subunit 1
MPALIQQLRDCSLNFAHRPALWVEDREYSYRELFEQADLIACQIQQLTTTDAVLVLSKKSFKGYAGILSCFLAGVTYIPLNDSFPTDKLVDIIQSSGCTTLLADPGCEESLLKLLQQLPDPLTVLVSGKTSNLSYAQGVHTLADNLDDNESVNECEASYANGHLQSTGSTKHCAKAEPVSNSHLAYLMFTSGSTGKPKGVPVSTQNLLSYLEHIRKLYDFTPYDRHSQFFEFTFDLSMHDIMVCWTSGGCLYAADGFAKLMPLHFASKHKLTVWFSVPSQVSAAQAVLKNKFFKQQLPDLRYSLFCGEALPASLARDWASVAPHSSIDNLYGPTEATIAYTWLRVDPDKHGECGIIPIGKPFGDNKIMVLDEQQRLVASSEIGQLYLYGPQVVAEYWQDPANTQKSFLNLAVDNSPQQAHLYCTGDLVSQSPSGELAFHGRADQQIKMRGYRIELQEIENKIRSLTGSQQVAVLAHPIGINGEVLGLAAFYDALGFNEHEMILLCRKVLPDYMIPSRGYNLAKFPHNTNGKVDRKALLTLAEQDEHDERQSTNITK